MKRWMFRALWKDEQTRGEAWAQVHASALDAHLKSRKVSVCHWFAGAGGLYIYAETEEAEEPSVIPRDMALQFLQMWPGYPESKPAALMMDVFHDGEPASMDSWRGSRKVERRVGSLARLKPEMYSSYVYYHYQMQEERPSGFNQTYRIGAHENMLFSYFELPASLEYPKREARLKTNHTPQDWHAVMLPHFIPWEAEDEEAEPALWRELQLIYQYERLD
ncbi:L-rhamnose mutarotase [Paenibacillus agaridevorans]|uniref:L-rhamnose mutarotase n=1 Tax=Paenibacillus agaridevorans TaxID=171404 RepID=UPI001BE3D53A|nr:L-rhamnose mutarotase [Paenibacillus agaridevorans]